MTDILKPLILDFLTWLTTGPRPYDEVMDAWHTNCPRLTVWEDASERGFVARWSGNLVEITPLGQSFLAGNGRHSPT